MPRFVPALLLLLVLVVLGPGGVPQPGTAAPQASAPWPITGLRLVAGGFSQPLLVTHDGTPGHLYVVEQGGTIWRIGMDGSRPDAAWLDLAGQVNGCFECGLLGLAFPPDYATSRRFYTNHTRGRNGAVPPTDTSLMETVVTRWQTDGAGTVQPGSREEILVITQPGATHNGGHLLFGPDGMLWIGMGDGGEDNATQDVGNYSQRRAAEPINMRLLGKLLRIDVSTPTGYAIPPDNPLFDGERDEIWAFGLRNPWRFWIDPETNMLFVGDVGNTAWEELNVVPAWLAPGSEGFNFQWSCREGPDAFGQGGCAIGGQGPGFQAGPLSWYGRDQGDSITAGVVYRGPRQGALTGVFLYGDFVSGRLWGLRQNPAAVPSGWEWTVLRASTGVSIASFGQDAAGNAYVVDYQFGGQGKVFQIVEADCLPGEICQYLPAVFSRLVGGW